MYKTIIFLLLLSVNSCSKKKNKEISHEANKSINLIEEKKIDSVKITKEINEPLSISKLQLDSVRRSLEPDLISIEEFNNFKKKSNYIKVIEKYDANNKDEILGNGFIPEEINKKIYSTNPFFLSFNAFIN